MTGVTGAGYKPSLAQVVGVMFNGQTQQIGPDKSHQTRGRLNLKAVADVLATYDLDPADEIAKILAKRKPKLDGKGNPVLDPETGEPLTEPVLPTDLALKTHLELLRYTRPQLKAVEVTVKEPELTDEQAEARIKALLARRSTASE